MSLDRFTLLIDNQVFSVAEYEVNYDMFLGAGNFAADIDYTKIIDLSANEIPFEIRINDIPMMKGFVDKVTREYSKGSIIQKVSGRDMMQVLIDNYIMEPHAYPGKPVKLSAIGSLFGENTEGQLALSVNSIISDVWNSSKQLATRDPSSLKRLQLPSINFPVYAQNAMNLKLFQIKQIKTSQGQSMFQFFSNLLNGIGLYMYNVPGTNEIIIHSIQSDQQIVNYNKRCELNSYAPPYEIKNQIGNSGNNVISASLSQDITEYYKYLKFVGQCDTETDDFLSTSTTKKPLYKNRGVGPYAGLTKLKSTVLNVIDENVWKSDSKRLVNNELMAQNRKLYGFKYTVSGHTSPGSTEPYFFNHTATVTDVNMNLSNQSLLVCAVTYKGSKQAGQTTELELYSPSFVYRMISNPDVPRNPKLVSTAFPDVFKKDVLKAK